MANEKQSNLPKGDERLRRSAGDAVRGDRESASAERELKDGTAYSSEERRRMLREEWVQEVLPTPPAIPGFHLCWLSTTNSTDPVYKRLNLGYQLVKKSELKGFEAYSVEGGTYDGHVMCNEMILAKIPIEIYTDIMTVYHHEIPLEEEQMLRQSLVKEEEDRDGKVLGSVEGYDNFAKPKSPSFSA